MPRHLTLLQIESALSCGKSVEQFLGSHRTDGLAWLEIRPAQGRLQLWLFEVFDDGHSEFLDVYSFSPLAGEWPEVPLSFHDSATEALHTAGQIPGAKPDRWVNQFVLQDEYRDFLEK